MQPPKACIFDLDGVIVHTARFHYKAWKALADSLSIPFDKEQNEYLKGVSREESLKMILDMGNKRLPESEFYRLMNKKNERYLSCISRLDQSDISEGFLAFMKALTFKKIKCAVGSSSKNARRIIDQLALNSMFDAIVDGTQVVQTKPDPEVFLKAATAVGVPPQKCLVFEDAASGIEAAHRAGMQVVGVGESEALNEADIIIHTFKGLRPQEIWTELTAERNS